MPMATRDKANPSLTPEVSGTLGTPEGLIFCLVLLAHGAPGNVLDVLSTGLRVGIMPLLPGWTERFSRREAQRRLGHKQPDVYCHSWAISWSLSFPKPP